MAITIDWGGIPKKRIFVPQADLTLVSPGVYTHDTDAFRLELKDLEDDVEGMPWPRTHNHNTEIALFGVTYARAIEIINPYEVEYEDGQYTVLLTGSNNNIADVANGILVRNQVQVIPNNSAGLATPGFTDEDRTLLNLARLYSAELWQMAGLDAANPAQNRDDRRLVPGAGIDLEIVDNGVTSTVTRQ